MTLTGGWVALTSVFLITGFFVSWHRSRLVYRSQLPVATSNNLTERLVAALERKTAPTEPQPQAVGHPMVPFVTILFQTWGLWMLGGQVMFWGVKVIVAMKDADPAALLVWTASHWWLFLLAVVLAGGLGMAWRAWNRTPKAEVAPEVPHVPPPPYLTPVAPHQQAIQPTPAMWSLPTNAQWDQP